jgi:hypothetical protein
VTASSKTIFGQPWNYEKIGKRMIVCHPGMLHKKELFEKYGKLDTRYKIAGDLDFLIRLPKTLKTLHVNQITVEIAGAGISRTRVMARLREQRLILSRSSRHGPLIAYVIWLDKLWRYPISKILGIPH